MSEAVSKPDYVDDSLVYDFDMFRDPAYVTNPHARILDLLENAPPVFWTPRNGGHWMLMSHEANFKAARDVETFSSEIIPQAEIQELLKLLPEGSPHIPQPIPINVDPPMHSKYRAPLQRVFSPKTINDLKSDIRALAVELIDAIADQGECEFMTAVAEPLPVKIFLKMLGLPMERMPEYRALVTEHLASGAADPEGALDSLMRIAAIMRDTMLERRDNPQDDIISMLWKLEIDGNPTTLDDMENYAVLLFIAGLDTVMNGMGHGIRHIAEDQALQQELRGNPALISEAVEELLRRYTFTVPPRRVDKDTEFLGATMKKNDKVMLFLPGADLDSREYPEAEKFDLHREGKAHIAFNAGPHRCLGSHLARVELQILYEEMLSRLPAFRLDPNRQPVYKCGHVVGPETLHIQWDV